jgi:hypothetical protein
MNDIAGMRAKFKESKDYEAMNVTHSAEDKADAISKFHLPQNEYFERLIQTLESIKALSFTTKREAEVLTEIIELVETYKALYAEETN